MKWGGRNAHIRKSNDRITASADDPALARTAPAAPPAPEAAGADALPLQIVETAVHPLEADALPPSILERFANLSFLGRGGMGTVYRGFDKQLARDVAIKFVHVHDAALFLREARAQARITHDNVCKIYDVGFADGQPYITMQLVRGESLGVVAKEMTLEQKIKVIRDAASALHEAHRLGMVHRDVKPQNILVEKADNGSFRPFVMDFGLARIAGEQGATMTGQIAGTPAYMAPEQARGEIRSLDRRTDVYSLGATFYEILADRPPFVEEHPWQILARITTEDAPPLGKVCRNVPVDIETIVMKCLEREQSHRYDSARALGEDLQRYLDGDPVLARKSSNLYRMAKWARKHKLLVAGIVAAFVVATTLVVVGVRMRQMAAEETRIAQILGEDVKEMQLFIRYAHGLPLHDIERERAVIRKRLAEIEVKTATAGTVARGAGHYALGRGHLALQDPKQALDHLKQAEALGTTSAELQYALGRALVEIYRDKLDEVKRIADKKKQDAKRAAIDAEFKVPALAHLRRAADSRLEHPAFVEGLVALTEERTEDALRLAKQAQSEAPWFYEAYLLEAEAEYALGAKYKHDAEFDYDKMSAHFVPALEAYRRAAEMASSDPTVHETGCRILLQFIYADSQMGRHEAAKKHFDEGRDVGLRAVSADPKRSSAHFYRAWVYTAHSGGFVQDAGLEDRMRETIELAEKAASMQPENALAWWLVGSASRNLEDLLVSRGIPDKGLTGRMIAAYDKAITLDANFLWPVRELAFAYITIASDKERQGLAPFADYQLAVQWLDHANEIAPNTTTVQAARWQLKVQIAASLFARGEDPTSSLGEASRTCDDLLRQMPNDTLTRTNCSYLAYVQTDVAFATGKDPMPFVQRQLELTGKINTTTSSVFHLKHAFGYASAAHVAWTRGENPINNATRAIEIYKVATYGHYYLPKPILTLLNWHMSQKSATNALFREMLDLYVPLVKDHSHQPVAMQSLAAIHAYHAEWLVDNRKDPSDALRKGAEFIEKTFAINARYAPAFATRGHLLWVEARAAKKKEPRLELAQKAKASFDEALRLNKNLARETETMRKEVDRLLETTPH